MTESHGKPRRAVDDPEAQPDVSDSAPLTPPPGYDADRIEAAVREFLLGIGEDPDREGLRDTPQRVARACAELIAGLDSQTLQYQLLPLHYIATDKEGNTAVIEIANGQLKVYNQNTLPYPVLSNNLYPNSLKYLRNYKGFGGQMPVVHRQGSNERFVSVCSIMEKSGEIKNPDKFAMRILDTVKQHDTQLSIIYSPDKMTIRFKTYGQIDEHQVKITPAMFSPAEKPRFINVETISATRIKNSHFKELTKTEHQDLLTSVSKKMEEEEMLNDKTREFLQMILNMNY